MAKKSDGGRARSAKTGRFVTKETADRHPDTTIVERPKRGKK